MADDPAVGERGVLTAAAERRDLAVRRAEVIGQLAGQSTVGLAAAEAAAAELGVSPRRMYVLIGRWRAGEGLASDLLPAPPAEAVVADGSRMRWKPWYGGAAGPVPDAAAADGGVGLRVPSRGMVLRCVAGLDPVKAVSARERR